MAKQQQTLAEATSSRKRDNNLDMIRFFAAVAVIISHSFTLSLGYEHGDYLGAYTDGRLSLGGFAVGIFFFYGGILIAKSCQSHPQALDYFKRRCVRIMPQLAFVVFTLALLIGPILTTLSLTDYYTSPDTWLYLLNSVFILRHTLPGVFVNNPFPNDPNGVLWTLPTEFLCYILCFIAFKLSRYDKKKFALLGAFCLPVIFAYVIFFNFALLSVVRAILLFAIGVVFFVYRDNIVLTSSWGWASVGIFVFLIALKLDIIAMLLVFPYMMVFLGWGTTRRFSDFAKYGEFSYGIFLWGWPIQQILVLLWPTAMIPWQNAAIATLLALGMGIVNDLLVDKPFKRWLAKREAKKRDMLQQR